MPKRSFVFTYGIIGAAASLVLVACGSSSKTSSGPTTTAASAASPATSAAGQGAFVQTRTDAKLGTILADASGKTLYTLTNNGAAVACTGPCLAVWPALSPPGGTTPTGGPGVSGLGVVDGPNGDQLVTVNNLPLHLFTGDAAAGEANGEGVQSFGGVWHVVKSTGTTPPSSSPSAPAATSSRGGGY